MSDPADDAAALGLDEWGGSRSRPLPFWPSEAQAGKPLHPMFTQTPKTCRQCGKGFLFWKRVDGKWRLHHYAQLPNESEPRFVLHRCGFASDGRRKTIAQPGRENPDA